MAQYIPGRHGYSEEIPMFPHAESLHEQAQVGGKRKRGRWFRTSECNLPQTARSCPGKSDQTMRLQVRRRRVHIYTMVTVSRMLKKKKKKL